MTRIARAVGICLAALTPAAAFAAPTTWIVTTDLWGNPAYSTLIFDDAKPLTGSLDGDPLTGRRAGREISFIATGSDKTTMVFSGRIDGDRMTGTSDGPDTNDPKARASHAFTARRQPERPAGPPRRHEFVPTDYSNLFDQHRTPVLTIWPGDWVHTKTVDSGGVDEHGKTVALFGNPQTGPFFVAGAEQGDTLAVHIVRLRLNRDTADSLDGIVGRVLGPGFAAKAADLGRPVRWSLDRVHGTASPAGMPALIVPMRPMLGGLAVAPGFGSAPISTGDTGRFGGNMDFNEIVEGNIVYLPVQQPGALLYLGDAHALQGDGETSQYALETSMDVEFRVELVKGKAFATPRVESPTQIMALGQAGSLDEATRSATTGIIQWLGQDYGLTLSQSAQVLGSAVEYTIVNLAGRSVGVAAKLDKSVLEPLRRK